jgi:hypothetical protein
MRLMHLGELFNRPEHISHRAQPVRCRDVDQVPLVKTRRLSIIRLIVASDGTPTATTVNRLLDIDSA